MIGWASGGLVFEVENASRPSRATPAVSSTFWFPERVATPRCATYDVREPTANSALQGEAAVRLRSKRAARYGFSWFRVYEFRPAEVRVRE